MAYFETLGQLQSNDEGLIQIYSAVRSLNSVLSSTQYNFNINDIILVYAYNANNTSDQVTVTINNVAGTNRIYANSGYANQSTYKNSFGLYIGKVVESTISIVCTGANTYLYGIHVFRLCPRN